MSVQPSSIRKLTIAIASSFIVAVCVSACSKKDSGDNGGSGGGTPPSTTPTLASLSVNPASVVGGAASQGTVSLSTAPSAGASVTLSSSAAAATVPASVTVNSGTTTASFSIATSTVATSTPVTITGSFNGTQSATLTLTPPAPPPPPSFTARMTIRSLTAAVRKTSNGTTPVPGKGAGALDTCPLVPDNNNTPQLSCEFDGGTSTSPNTIVSYRWSWKVGNNQADGQNNSESKFQPKVSNCGFFAGQSDGGTQQLQMVVELTIRDNLNNATAVTNQNVSVFPAGLCGYDF